VFAPKAYYNARWVIPPVAMSVFFIFSYDLFAKFEFYYERTTLVMLASLIGAVLNIILNILFIPIFGYYAAGYVTLLCYMAYVVCHYLFMIRVCKDNNIVQPYSTKILLTMSVVFMLLGFAILISYKSVFLRLSLIGMLVLLGLVKRKSIIEIVERTIQIKK